jgi:signal transduction histidine kinase
MKFTPLSRDAGRVIAPGFGAGLHDLAVPGACVLLAAAGAAGAWWLSGPRWLPAVIAAIGLGVAGWRAGVAFAGLRNALRSALRDRASMEDSLRESQKMEALGRLTVGIVHDFNNHLTVISSNVEMVRRRLDSGQERLRRHSDAALQGVQRAAALTGRLMSLARQSVAEPEALDIRRLLTGLSDLLRRIFGKRPRWRTPRFYRAIISRSLLALGGPPRLGQRCAGSRPTI